jgi:hypothetical protein
MRTSVKALLIMPSRNAPNSTPGTVPLPPSTLTPPTTEAATVCNSKPSAVFVCADSKREAHSTPASPANRPEMR